jgi:hypothetical protein
MRRDCGSFQVFVQPLGSFRIPNRFMEKSWFLETRWARSLFSIEAFSREIFLSKNISRVHVLKKVSVLGLSTSDTNGKGLLLDWRENDDIAPNLAWPRQYHLVSRTRTLKRLVVLLYSPPSSTCCEAILKLSHCLIVQGSHFYEEA